MRTEPFSVGAVGHRAPVAPAVTTLSNAAGSAAQQGQVQNSFLARMMAQTAAFDKRMAGNHDDNMQTTHVREWQSLQAVCKAVEWPRSAMRIKYGPQVDGWLKLLSFLPTLWVQAVATRESAPRWRKG